MRILRGGLVLIGIGEEGGGFLWNSVCLGVLAGDVEVLVGMNGVFGREREEWGGIHHACYYLPRT